MTNVIEDVEDFSMLYEKPDGKYVLAHDFDFSDNLFLEDYLPSIIVNLLQSDVEYESFGTFKGHFDGNGHTIRGIDDILGDGCHIGLFSQNYGTIENLNIKNINVTGKSEVGSIVAQNKSKGTVRNCSVSGNITGSDSVGGLVGYNKGEVLDCSFEGGISGKDTVGGIAGCNAGNVKDCSTDVSIQGNRVVGGIIGHSSEIVETCRSNANIDCTSLAGGLVGINSGRLRNSGCSIGISRDKYNLMLSGFVAGRNEGSIDNCYWVSENSDGHLNPVGEALREDYSDISELSDSSEIQEAILIGAI